jgi:hypothetical protein
MTAKTKPSVKKKKLTKKVTSKVKVEAATLATNKCACGKTKDITGSCDGSHATLCEPVD